MTTAGHRLTGRTVWVIGASSGIGAALAAELVDRGARVAISARREDQHRDVFARHVEVNLLGLNNCIGAVLPQMLRAGGGRIVSVASVAGYRGLAGAEAYGATKAAQINMLEALRVALAGQHISVVTVCPGFVRTDLTAGNTFRMPFMIEAEDAARSICNGLERGRLEIVFPAPMAALMKIARFVPVRLWAAAMSRTTNSSKGAR